MEIKRGDVFYADLSLVFNEKKFIKVLFYVSIFISSLKYFHKISVFFSPIQFFTQFFSCCSS